MIHYLVTGQHAYTMQSFLESWGRELASGIAIVPYEEVMAGRRLPSSGASYVFSDLDRLSPEALAVLGRLRDKLVEVCGEARVLNDPARSRQRLDLLRALHERGINHFDAHRVDGDFVPARFPVFVRPEGGWQRDQLSILRNEAEYRAAIRTYRADPTLTGNAVAIEFCDTADPAGIYRKYGAFVVGDRIVPRHVFFSRNWMVKLADLADPALIQEELAYMDGNPHAEALREAAAIARISYGRIDYSLLDGRPQIWEINTNPMLASVISSAIPERREAHLRFVRMIGAAFASLEAGRA